MKKLITIAIALTVAVMITGPGAAQALTAAELQVQITALLSQLTALQAQLSTLQGDTGGTVTGCTITSFDRNLKVGMTGDDVKCLQVVLNSATDTQLGTSGVGSSGNETSYFGPLTKAAVIKFQEKYTSEVLAVYGLTTGTGFVGTTTRAKLDTLLGVVVTPTTCTADADCSAGYVCTAGQCVQTVVPTGALGVTLASDTPVAETILVDNSDGDADGAQSMIPFVKLNFTNNGSGDMSVTELALTRIGVASDTDISQLYLYEGNTKLAEYSAFDEKVVTFTSSTGLFTVSAGQSKGITLKGDLANGVSGSRTIGFQLASADDVTTNATSVSGAFPLAGNKMTTATVNDLGQLTVSSGNSSATVDPGEINYELWEIKVETSDQKVQIERIEFTNVGSIDSDDIQNFKLEDSGGTQYGETQATLAADGTVTFDLSANPIVITEGSTKYYSLKGDIIGGTNRDFKFSFQNMADFVVKDLEYGIYIRPNQADSWTIVEADSDTSTEDVADSTNINTGSIIITRASDSPSGNIALDATNVELAKFNLDVVGEDVKITSLTVTVTVTNNGDATTGLDNVKLYLDGSQKDTTRDITVNDGAGQAFTFGNTFVVKAGETSVLLIKGDVKDKDATGFTAEDTIQIKLVAGSSNAQGKISMTSISTAASSGLTLIAKSGQLSTAKSNAMADASSGAPTGVPGSTNVKVASFTVLAGGGEGVDVSQFIFTDATTAAAVYAFDSLQNLVIKRQDTGEQIGTTRATLTYNNSYSFYPSPKISLAKSEQIVIDVYADILTGATSGGTAGKIVLSQVSGTGQETGTDAKDSDDRDGQAIYIRGNAALTVTLAADTPKAAMLVMGETNQVLSKFKFYETTGSEDVVVSQIIVTETTGTNVTADIKSIKLYDGSTLLATKADVGTSGEIIFSSLGWTIPAGTVKYLTVKADIGAYGTATSASDIILSINTEKVTARGEISGTSIITAPINDRDAKIFQVWKAIPVITTSGVSVDGGSLGAGQHDLFKFKITASGGPVDFYQWSFTVATTDAISGTWSLWDNTNSETVTASCTSAYPLVTCVVDGDSEEIGESVTKTYTLRNSNCTSSDVGDYVSVYMNSDTVPYGGAGGVTTAAAATVAADTTNSAEGESLIWSDEANVAHANDTDDWFNGYLIENIGEYTTSQSLQR